MNLIKKMLIDLNISSEESFVDFYDKVRDRDDISILKCLRSEVLLLSKTDHISDNHYKDLENFSYWNTDDRRLALNSTYEDDKRRFDTFRELVTNKRWLDIGTGSGGILDLLSPFALNTTAVELQENSRKELTKLGYNVFELIDECENDYFDFVTLFHVFEHFVEPIKELKTIKNKMKIGGKLIVEVPHARDVLLSFFENDAFMSHTFWSEHLILHTKNSLRIIFESQGFKNISIQGVQRYPLSNHLLWLSKGLPGGHKVLNQFNNVYLNNEYSNILSNLDYNDTLILTAEK